jgi:hypothetical protein
MWRRVYITSSKGRENRYGGQKMDIGIKSGVTSRSGLRKWQLWKGR